MKTKILVIGDADADIFLTIDHIPTWDEGLLAKSSYIVPGGKGANTAMQLSSLGADTTLFACIGTDGNGEIATSLFDKANLNCKFVIKNDNCPTTFCVMLLDDTGEKALVVIPSDEIYPTEEIVNRYYKGFSEYSHIHIIGLNAERTSYIVNKLSSFDCSISVDFDSANSGYNKLLPIMEKCDTIFLNKEGLSRLYPLVDERDAIKELSEKTEATVVCTLGANGVLEFSSGVLLFQPTQKISPIDTTGCGDAFAASYLYATNFLDKLGKEDVLKFSNKCSGKVAMSIGGQSKLLKSDTILDDNLPTKKILFYEPWDEYGYFCNLSPYSVVYDDKNWPTSEHCYQALKHTSIVYREMIRKTEDIEEVIRLGRNEKSGSYRFEDWDDVKVDLMHDVVLAKFSQNASLKKLLLETRDAQLVEHTCNDPFWGDNGDGTGVNWLGNVLMQVREELRK